MEGTGEIQVEVEEVVGLLLQLVQEVQVEMEEGDK
jgi:hypothetical protein